MIINWFTAILLGLCVVLVLLPPKWDPAIRLKERTLRKRQRKKAERIAVKALTGEWPDKETDPEKLWEMIANNHCPDCHGVGFYEGPSGGMSTNIQCANEGCKSRFNVTPIIGRAERI